jgi:hypothetical protein
MSLLVFMALCIVCEVMGDVLLLRQRGDGEKELCLKNKKHAPSTHM